MKFLDEDIVNNFELIKYSKENNIEKVENLCMNVWVNQRDKFGWSSLHYASFLGRKEVCKLLIDKGLADIDLQTSRCNETPLMLASANNHYEIVEYLLEKGANINILDSTGKNAIDMSYGISLKILINNRSNQNQLIRFIQGGRKILTNKFFQFLLQLLLCIFIEIFYDKLMSAAYKTLQFFIILEPPLRLFILKILYYIHYPIIIPIFKFIFFIVGPIIPFIYNILNIPIGIIWKLFLELFHFSSEIVHIIFKIIFYLLNPFFNFLINTFIYLLKENFIYRFMKNQNFLSFIYKYLQPRQLSSRLVSPIILAFSKLLYLLPSFWIEFIIQNYTKIIGKGRHISNEEIAVVSLLIGGIFIYVFGIFISGSILKMIYFIYCYYQNCYENENSIHELGLIFLLFIFPLVTLFRLIKYLRSILN